MKKSFLKSTYDDTGHIGLVLIPLNFCTKKRDWISEEEEIKATDAKINHVW